MTVYEDALWTEASHDHEAAHDAEVMGAAQVAGAEVWSVLASAESEADFYTRLALMHDSIHHVAVSIAGEGTPDYTRIVAALPERYFEDWHLLAEGRRREAQARNAPRAAARAAAREKKTAAVSWEDGGDIWKAEAPGGMTATVEARSGYYLWTVNRNGDVFAKASTQSLQDAKDRAEEILTASNGQLDGHMPYRGSKTAASQEVFDADMTRLTDALAPWARTLEDGSMVLDPDAPADLVRIYRNLMQYGYANGLMGSYASKKIAYDTHCPDCGQEGCSPNCPGPSSRGTCPECGGGTSNGKCNDPQGCGHGWSNNDRGLTFDGEPRFSSKTAADGDLPNPYDRGMVEEALEGAFRSIDWDSIHAHWDEQDKAERKEGSRKFAYTADDHRLLTIAYHELTGHHLVSDHTATTIAYVLDRTDVNSALSMLAKDKGHTFSIHDTLQAMDKAYQRVEGKQGSLSDLFATAAESAEWMTPEGAPEARPMEEAIKDPALDETDPVTWDKSKKKTAVARDADCAVCSHPLWWNEERGEYVHRPEYGGAGIDGHKPEPVQADDGEHYHDDPQPHPYYNAACPNCGEAHDGQCPYPWFAQHDAARKTAEGDNSWPPKEGGEKEGGDPKAPPAAPGAPQVPEPTATEQAQPGQPGTPASGITQGTVLLDAVDGMVATYEVNNVTDEGETMLVTVTKNGGEQMDLRIPKTEMVQTYQAKGDDATAPIEQPEGAPAANPFAEKAEGEAPPADGAEKPEGDKTPAEGEEKPRDDDEDPEKKKKGNPFA